MEKELIIVKQLPIIEETLKNLSKEIKVKTDKATSLVATEDTVKEIKSLRAELNKDFNELETQRKSVKNAIMEKYNEFEGKYKEYVTKPYSDADNTLKTKVDSVESKIKETKEAEIKLYFEEYKTTEEIDFITYEMANIKVGLSDSMKSLRESAKSFVDTVKSDLKLINTQEFAQEILIEYKESLNVSDAITKVVERHQKLAEMQKPVEEEQKKQETVNEVLQKAVEKKAKAEEITAEFTVTASKEKLQELIKFLKEGGYKYE